MNYTIYTGTNLADIPPKLVFTRLKEILHGKIILQKERFAMQGVDANQYALNMEEYCIKNKNI